MKKKQKAIKTAEMIAQQQEHGKTIAINQLPDCIHKTRLINSVMSSDARICVVACREGIQNRWVAYAGYPDVKDLKPSVYKAEALSVLVWSCENIHDASSVKILGETLSKKIAGELFPEWDIDLYSAVG